MIWKWLYYQVATEQSKYSNCAVNIEEICFHQAHLIYHLDQGETSLSIWLHDPLQNPGQTRIFYKLDEIHLSQTKPTVAWIT